MLKTPIIRRVEFSPLQQHTRVILQVGLGRVAHMQTFPLPWEVERPFLIDLRLKEEHTKEDQKRNNGTE